MNSTYEVINNIVVKKYSLDEKEEICLLEDIDIIISRTRETLDRMESKLKSFINKDGDNVLSIMFYDYVHELNELNKIKLLNKKEMSN